MKIELYSRRHLLRRRYYFRFVAGNGEIIAQSEGYSRKIDARTAAGLIKRNASKAKVVEL